MNAFQTAAHCARFADRMAAAMNTAFHVLKTLRPDCVRRVVTDAQLQQIRREGILALVEYSARPTILPAFANSETLEDL